MMPGWGSDDELMDAPVATLEPPKSGWGSEDELVEAPDQSAPQYNSFDDLPVDMPSGEKLAFAMKRLRELPPEAKAAKNTADRAYYWAQRWPGMGAIASTVGNLRVADAAKRIEAGQGTKDDYGIVAWHLNDQEDRAARGFGGQVADTVTQIPGFAAEMLLSGGVYSAGKAGVQQLAKKAIGETVERGVGKLATGTVARAAGVAAQAATMPTRVAANASQRSMPSFEQRTDEEGKVTDVQISDEDKGFLAALPAAFLDTMIEVGSERSGDALGKGFGQVVGRIPGANRLQSIKKAVVDHWLSKPGRTGSALADTLKKAGWNGVVNEYLEERAGDAARLATGLESPDENVVGQVGQAGIEASVGNTEKAKELLAKAGEQSAVEAASSAVFGGAAGAVGAGIDDLQDSSSGRFPWSRSNRAEQFEPRVEPTSQPRSVLRKRPPAQVQPTGEQPDEAPTPGSTLVKSSSAASAGITTSGSSKRLQGSAGIMQHWMGDSPYDIAKDFDHYQQWAADRGIDITRQKTLFGYKYTLRSDDETRAKAKPGILDVKASKSVPVEQPTAAPPAASVAPEQQESVPDQPSDPIKAAPEQAIEQPAAPKFSDLNLSYDEKGNLDRESEAALLRVAKTGDKEARDKFASHFYPMVKGLAGKAKRAVGNQMEFDDLQQIGNAALTRAMDKYDPDSMWTDAETGEQRPAKFSTYLHEAVSKSIWDEIKKLKRKVSVKQGADIPDDVDPSQVNPRDLAAAQEDLAWLDAAIPKLSPKQRKVMEGKRLGKSLQQIADEQGVTKQRIEQVDKAAKKRLQQIRQGVAEEPSAAEQDDFKKGVTKVKGTVQFKVGQDNHERFVNDMNRLVEKLQDRDQALVKGEKPAFDDAAISRQLAIIDEKLADASVTEDQKKILSGTRAALQKIAPQQQAEAKTRELTPQEKVANDVRKGLAKIQGRYANKVPKGQPKEGAKTPISVVATGPANQGEQEAADFARSLGLEPVFFKSSDGSKLPVRGISEGKAVFIRSGEGEALWETVGHEIAHGTGFDKLDKVSRDQIEAVERQLLGNDFKLSDEYVADMRGNPELLRREAVAHIVQKFLASSKVRDQIKRNAPTLWERIIRLVDSLLPEGFKSVDPNVQATVDYLRQVRADQFKDEQGPSVPGADGTRGFGLGALWSMFNPPRQSSLPPLRKQEAQERTEAAHGMPTESLPQKAKRIGSSAIHSMTRAYKFIPNDPHHASMREQLRLMKQHPKTAAEDATNTVAAIVKDLKPQEYELFSRKVILDNLHYAVTHKQPLRFGYESADEVKLDKDDTDALVAQSQPVQLAIQKRNLIKQALVNELRNFGLLGKLTPEQVEAYFHQQIVDDAMFRQVGGRNPQLTKAGFRKNRTEGVDEFDASLDYNTAYHEAEYSWLRDANLSLAKERWLDTIDRMFGIKSRLQAQAKQNGTTWEDELRAWNKAHPDRQYAEWQGEPGSHFYKAIGVKESVVNDVIAGLKPTATVGKDDLNDVVALGDKKRQMVLPRELVDQLDSMAPENIKDGVVKELSREAQSAIKTWLLLGPGVIPYTARNIFGDLDAAIGGAPGLLKYAETARKDMLDYYGLDLGGLVSNPAKAAQGVVKTARDFGIMDSSFTVSELTDIRDNPYLKHLFDVTVPQALQKIPKGYFDWMRKRQSFRESILRYAAFLYYRDALAAGTLSHYGASKKENVDRIKAEMGTDAAAAHLARNLFGDYANLTVMGDALRQHLIPFHAWTEITLKRYPQMIRNAALSGPRRIGKVNAKAVGLSAAALAAIAAPYVLMHLWNNLFDEEDKLSPTERAMPHLIVGIPGIGATMPDGHTLILRNMSSFGDFLEQFGILTAIGMADDVSSGQASVGDVVQEAGGAIMARHANSISPYYKALYEQMSGKPMYPAPWASTAKPRDEMLAGQVALPDTYRAIKGWWNEDGTRSRPNATLKLLVGVTDPKKNALYEILDARDRFQQKNGTPSFPRNRYAANMQNAAEVFNQEAFEEARTKWLTERDQDSQGDFNKFQDRLKNLDPLARLNQTNGEEERFIKEYLTADQRKKLITARDFGNETKERMIRMWNEAEKKDPPELKQALQEQKERWLLNRADQIIQDKPTTVTPLERKNGLTLERKQAQWELDRQEAIHGIITSGLGREQVEDLLRAQHDSEIGESGGKAKNVKQLIAAKKEAAQGRAVKMRRFKRILDKEW